MSHFLSYYTATKIQCGVVRIVNIQRTPHLSLSLESGGIDHRRGPASRGPCFFLLASELTCTQLPAANHLFLLKFRRNLRYEHESTVSLTWLPRARLTERKTFANGVKRSKQSTKPACVTPPC